MKRTGRKTIFHMAIVQSHDHRAKKCSKINLLVLFFCFSLQCTTEAKNNKTKPQDYGIIIDAGSSGSRVRVYAWNEGTWFPGHDGDLPEITEIHNKKISPGISSFGGNLNGLDAYITGLIQEAKDAIPEAKHHETRIYVFATAGMRLLMEDEANNVMFAINDLLLDPSINPFEYEPLNTRIISGEEEGVFAWISVNYLRDFFTFNNGVEDGGIIELGGASAQIAFQHNGSVLADKFPVSIAGRIYPLYVHSYLGFGQEQVIAKQQELVIDREPQQNGQILDPCLVNGDNLTTTVGDLEIVEFLGTGDAEDCLEYMDEIVYEAPEDWCLPKPCAIGAVYQPNVNPQMPFYALSALVFPLLAMDQIPGDVLNEDYTFSISEARQAAAVYCATPVSTLKENLSYYDSKDCIAAVYGSVLLEKGLKFSATTRQIHAVQNINDQPIEWPLGALIYETERHLAECEIRVPNATSSIINNSNYALFLSLNFVFVFLYWLH